MTPGLLSLRARPGPAAAGALAAVALGWTAALSPHATVLLCIGIAALIVTLRSLLAGLVLFTVVTFPSNLPAALSVGSTVAKPLGVAVAASWAVRLLNDRSTPFLLSDAPAVGWSAIGLTSWAALSAAWAPDPGAVASTVARLAQVVLLMFVAYSAVRAERDLLVLAAGYVVAASATAAYALANGQTVAGRLTGGVQNPNFLAMGMVSGIAVGAFLLAVPLRPAVRAVVLALLAVDAVAFVRTASRGGLVAAAVILVAGVVFAGPLRSRAVAAAAVVASTGVAYFSFVGAAGVVGRVTTISLQASSGRIDLWRIALHVAADHPLLGVGLGNFPVVEFGYFRNTANLVDPRLIQELHGSLVVHNTYLELLAELGPFGLALFLGLVGLVAVRVVPLVIGGGPGQWAVGRAVTRGLVVATCGLLANFIFDSEQYAKQLWLLLGLLVAAGVAGGRREGAGGRLPGARP